MLSLRRLTNPKTLQTLARSFLSKPQTPNNPSTVPFSWTRTLSSTTEKDSDGCGDEVLTDVEELNEGLGGGKEGGNRRSVATPLVDKVWVISRYAVNGELSKWVADGSPLGRDEVNHLLGYLRNRRNFSKALQVLDWLEANRHMEFEERDYAFHVDMIAKVHGPHAAEKYINKIPKVFRGQLIYENLLANYAAIGNIKKAEETFNKIRDLGLSITSFACNHLLLIYKRLERKKITDVLTIMEKANLKPSRFTYNILIDAKGNDSDISGMEEIVEMMEAEGVEPDRPIQAMIAKYYILGGFSEKAEAVLKEMEGNDINENRIACKYILPLYASLGKINDVERIWKVCEEDSPRIDECSAAIRAWGELGQIENAEKVFEYMLESYDNLSPKYYNVLLKVYAKHKLVSEGKNLARRMSENGLRIGPVTMEALVKLFVESGEVEKADLLLQNAQQNNTKPFYNSYMTVLDEYAKRGDVENAEKVFNRLRQSGYMIRMKVYQSLIIAYQTAKVPTYGFMERMKADNLFPNKEITAQLASAGKSRFADLLN